MTAARSVTVFGNSVAAMMSSLALGEAGWRVTMVSPSKRLGGHFAGIALRDTVFDAGMVLMEFTSFNADSHADLRTYDPARRNDVGRFFPLVASTLERFSSFEPVDTPQMRVQGRKLPDLLIANQVSSLRRLDAETQAAMSSDLRSRSSAGRGPMHASRKAGAEFATVDLADASMANHGPTLHDLLMEPFARKVTGRSTVGFLAAYHRLVWLPLYYPETLLAALGGDDAMPRTVFSQPTSASVASLVQAIERQVRATEHVTVVEGTLAAIDFKAHGTSVLHLSNGAAIESDRVVWASDQEQLLTLLGTAPEDPLEKGSIALASVLIDTDGMLDAFSTLLIPENEAWPFRVTIQERTGSRTALTRVSCEWNTAYLPTTPADMTSRTEHALVELGIIKERSSVSSIRVDVMKNALLLPTLANARRWSERRLLLDDRCPHIPRLGPASPFGATSLNDQIVQGLKVVHDLHRQQ